MGTGRRVAVAWALLTLAPGAAGAQDTVPARGTVSVAVTPEFSLARLMDHPFPEAAAIGIRLELSRGGPVAITLDANAWGFAVACFETVGFDCRQTATSGVVGIQYAPAFAVMGRVAPYIGAGGGLMRGGGGGYGLTGVARVGIDIGLHPRTALRVETRYQPVRHEWRVPGTDEAGVDMTHFHGLGVGLRVELGSGPSRSTSRR